MLDSTRSFFSHVKMHALTESINLCLLTQDRDSPAPGIHIDEEYPKKLSVKIIPQKRRSRLFEPRKK